MLRRILPVLSLVVERKKLPIDHRDEGIQIDQRMFPSLGSADAPSHVVSTSSLPQRRPEATNDGGHGAYERLHDDR
jgi:hypothetical protein